MSAADAAAWDKVHKNKNLKCQSREICSKEHIRIAASLKADGILDSFYDGVHTMYDVFQRGIKVAGDHPCVGYKPGKNSEYKWITYNQTAQRATNFGSGMISKLGIKAGQDTLVGVYAKNMVEWVVAEKALTFYNMILIPYYNTLGDQALRYITKQTEIEVIVIDAVQGLKDFNRDVLSQQETNVKHVIMIDKADSDAAFYKEISEKYNIQIHSFADIESAGANSPVEHTPPKPDDVSVINYTSGTTGDPKGVMLTNKNFVADACGALYMAPRPFNKDDVWYSYLPLPHVFERMVQVVMMQVGARIGFYSGDIREMPGDLGKLKPTVFGGVPRVWTRFYDKIGQATAGSWLKTKLMNMAMASKKSKVEKGIIENNTIWDKIVFKKVQTLLGGRVNMAITGAAPINPDILNTLRAAFGSHIIEGYGQTECAAALSATLPGDHEGTVGAPLVCNQVKLVDVPDMNYFAKDNKGEVCVRGANVMKGYYKNPEKTAETIDEDGWLHTGDIGTWTSSGALKLIDRKKNIFKLSQGEYIAPEKVENIYITAPSVMQVYLHGDSLQAQLVAVVVPDAETFEKWVTGKGMSGGNIKDLCERDDVKKAVLAEMTEVGKKSLLKAFEQAKAIHLESDPFSVEKDLLTPTFKSKRPQLAKYYSDQIAEMYAKLNPK